MLSKKEMCINQLDCYNFNCYTKKKEARTIIDLIRYDEKDQVQEYILNILWDHKLKKDSDYFYNLNQVTDLFTTDLNPLIYKMEEYPDLSSLLMLSDEEIRNSQAPDFYRTDLYFYISQKDDLVHSFSNIADFINIENLAKATAFHLFKNCEDNYFKDFMEVLNCLLS